MKTTFLIFFIVLCICFRSCFCEQSESSDVSDADVNFKKLTSTTSGIILFYGWKNGYQNDYDASKLTEKQKEDCSRIGLSEISDLFKIAVNYDEARFYSELLARYYLLKKDTKKSLFWSSNAAENGSSFCMRVLALAYLKGDGVVHDFKEWIKWMYLGAAAGEDVCKLWVQEEGIAGLYDKDTASLYKEAQKSAKNWMETHNEIFFNAN